MTATQLTAIRNLWTDLNTHTTMTAREMALTAHNLSRDGMKAKTSDGRRFIWNDNQSLWIQAIS